MQSFAFVLSVCAWAACAAGLEVKLRPSADVSDEFVRLRDIAEVTAEPALEALVLGRAPAPGERRDLGREDVRTAVRRARPDLRVLELTGAASVAVSRVDPPPLAPGAEAVADAIRRWGPVAAAGGRCEVDVIGVEPEPPLGLPLLVREGVRAGPEWSFTLLALDLEGGESETRARARVRIFADAAVVRRNLPAKQVLAAADLEVRTVEVAPDQVWFAAGALPLGRRLERPLRAGEVVTESLLRPAVAVRAQERVQLEVPGPGFAVRLDGVALDAGATGQVIRLKTKDGTVLHGRVTGPGAVRLEQGGER